MKIIRCLLLLTGLALTRALAAADAPPPQPSESEQMKMARKMAAALNYQHGTVTVGDGLAKIALPESYRYLNTKDTETVLTKFWGNPGGGNTLGMIVPADFDPLTGDNWAVVLGFDDDGYVKDDDAAKIDYNDLMQQMKKDVTAGNAERTKQGYESIELVGWASPPRYDAAAHKLYWAKELKFGTEADHTLNYNIRMLGRRGVLVLNAVAPMARLKDVEAATPALLGMVNFADGHRYADFNDSTDKTATYGLAALVAGGIAAKAGFFKVLWVGILAFKKVIIIGALALAGWFKKIWDGIRSRKTVAITAPTNPPDAT
jgi:uncharacterized membrane-anchored protein